MAIRRTHRLRRGLAAVAVTAPLAMASACADPCAEVQGLTEADRTVLANGGEPAEREGAYGEQCEYDDGRFQVDE